MRKNELTGDTRINKEKPIKKRFIREEHGSQVLTFGRGWFPPDWKVVSIGNVKDNKVIITRIA